MAESTKERIINAVFSFYRDGKIKKISLSKIAAEVGISKAAIFRHFANREELEETLLQTVYDRFSAMVAAAEKNAEKEGNASILPFVIEKLCLHSEYIDYMRSTSTDFSLDSFAMEGKKRGICMFDSIFEDDGSIRNRNLYYIAVFVCVELLEFVHIWNFHGGNESETGDYASKSASFIYTGLKREAFAIDAERLQSLETTCLSCVLNAMHIDSRLAALSAAVSKKGYAELTMDSIATELGMAKSSFYSTYKNKEDMIVTLLESEFSEFRRILDLSMREAREFDECVFCIICTTSIYFFKRKEILEACKWIEFQMADGKNADDRFHEIVNSSEYISFRNTVFGKNNPPDFSITLAEPYMTMAQDFILNTAFGAPLLFLSHGIKHDFPLSFYMESNRMIYRMLMTGVMSYADGKNIWGFFKEPVKINW